MRKIIAVVICLALSLQSVSILAYAEDTYNPSELLDESQNEFFPVDEDIIDISSYVSIVPTTTVNDILAQWKFSARQGHGFAAERGNDLIDKIKLKNTRVVGDNNVKNGADRLIIGRDGTKIWIQDKYYASGKLGIDACFDEAGKFRYFDGDGNPMQIEVPKDQYEEAVQRMREKISEGKVEGITDPDEAETLVRKGHLTYKQAQNLAKAGTFESITYDAINGAITATCSIGISTILNYAVLRINGENRLDALKSAAIEGVKTGGLVFCASVIASQLGKTGLLNVFAPSSEAIVEFFGDDFARLLLKATGEEVVQVGAETTSRTLTTNAAKVLRTEALTSAVFIVVFSIPDAIDLFKGRISKKQFIKNFAVAAVAVVAGAAGGFAGGALTNLLVPGVGTIPGSIVGSILFGGAGAWLADKIADYITSDDAEEMYEIVKEKFASNCEDYLVTEEEAKKIADNLSGILDEDLFKEMYQSNDRKQFAEDMLNPLFEKEIAKRGVIDEPTEEEMRKSLLIELNDVVFIH